MIAETLNIFSIKNPDTDRSCKIYRTLTQEQILKFMTKIASSVCQISSLLFSLSKNVWSILLPAFSVLETLIVLPLGGFEISGRADVENP